MAEVVLGRGYFPVAAHLPPAVHRALERTLDSLAAAASLPGLEDVPDKLPPVMPCHRRRVGASAWWVYFTVVGERVVVVAVAIPP